MKLEWATTGSWILVLAEVVRRGPLPLESVAALILAFAALIRAVGYFREVTVSPRSSLSKKKPKSED